MPSVTGIDNDLPLKGYGVRGESGTGTGVIGRSFNGNGAQFITQAGYGVFSSSHSGIGVYANSDNYIGIRGLSGSYIGVFGSSNNAIGVYGLSNSIGTGVYGYSVSGTGTLGYSSSGYGIYGFSSTGYAAYLDGRVYIRGPLSKPGGQFKIDHPLDPANKYLCHSFVESPDMKNVYDGVVALDRKGEAEIELPDWFSALNQDFRYQLTAIGAPGPNLYIAEKISDTTTSNKNKNSRFKIAGGTSGMEVSWQVTGIRKDPWANANRIEVEEDKPAKEQGYYLHPDLYGQPEERGISHLLFPKEKQELLINEKKTNL